MTVLFRFPALLLTALLALGSVAGCARAEPLVSMSVVDLDRGETLPRWPHGGRDYIEGRPGHRYSLVLQNLTGGRVLAIVSVDGVNAISGETAGTKQSGYVLDPWQRMEVRGWRKNLSETAEFYFTSLGDSYAARTGRPGNVGVIGVAAYRERAPVYPVYPPPPQVGYGERRDGWYSRSDAPAAAEAQSAPSPVSPPAAARAESGAAADAAAGALSKAPSTEAYRDYDSRARQQLGTGHGERRWDAATVTHFERASTRPQQVETVWYDAWEALAARGIVPQYPRPYYEPSPDAFPIGFAPDP